MSTNSLLCARPSFSELVADVRSLCALPALKIINPLPGGSQRCPSILVAVGLAWLKTPCCPRAAVQQKMPEQQETGRWPLWHRRLLIP